MAPTYSKKIRFTLSRLNFFSLDKYGNDVWNNNCMNCLYYFSLKMTSIISPMRGKCRHMTRSYNGETKFWYSKRGLIVPFIFLISNLAGTVLFLYSMLSSCSEDRLKCLLELHDHILIINTIIFIIIFQIKMIVRADELNDITHLINHRNYFGIRVFINRKYGQEIYMINHMNISVSGILIIFFGFATFVNKGMTIFNYHDICMFICQGVQFSIACQVSQKLVVMTVIYRAVHRCLRKRLRKSLREGDKSPDSLDDHLRKFINLYLELKVIMNKICDFMNPILVVWLLSHLALCVFNCYALIQVINIQPAFVIIFAQAKTTVTILVIISIFTDCQKLLDEVSTYFFQDGNFQFDLRHIQ